MTTATPVDCVAVALVAIAAIYDLRTRRIPNWLTMTALASGILLNTALWHWSGLGRAATGFGLALLIYLPLYALHAMGGGDVKLMAALGCLVGPSAWFYIFILTAITGGIVALVVVLAQGLGGRTVRNIAHILNEISHLRSPHHSQPELDVANPAAVGLPHGAVIALGTLLYFLL